jgi:hypothetical protein
MLKSKSFPMLTGVAALLVTGLLASAPAQALVFDLTSDHCTGGCGTAPFGTVTLLQNGANDVQVTVSLLDGNKFVTTGSGDPLDFNLTGNPTITETFPLGSVFGPGQTAGGGGFSIHADGTGFFEYSVLCPSCGSGASNAQPGPLVVDIGAAGITPASFITNATGNFFAVDIISGTTGNTGPVDASVPVPAPPIGHGPLVLLAVGGLLFGAKLFGRSRNHRGTAIPYAVA